MVYMPLMMNRAALKIGALLARLSQSFPGNLSALLDEVPHLAIYEPVAR
jgi:hypothetical protein